MKKTKNRNASRGHSPIQDLSLERQRYLLKPVLLGLAGPGFLYGLAIVVMWLLDKAPPIAAILGFGIQLFCILAYMLNQRGKIRSSAYMSVLALFLVIYAGSYYFGIGHALLVGYAIVAMLAGILIDTMAALFFAAVSMAAYLLIGQAQQGNILPRELSPETTIIPDAIGLAIGLIVLIIFLWLYERQMKKIIKRDRELNAKVAEANELLKRELAERTRAEEEVKQKLGFEQTITSISSRFVGASDIDSAITRSLGDIVSLCGASNAFLYKFHEHLTKYKKTHEWYAVKKKDENNNLQYVFNELIPQLIPQWVVRLRKGEVIQNNDYSQIPQKEESETGELHIDDVQSLLILPLHSADELTGFIALENVTKTTEWREENFAVLRVLSEIIGNALERNRLEEQLLQSQKMEAVGRLAGGVAHDFNNILTAILGYSYMALKSLSPDEPLYKDITDIHKASERASSLTYQLLAFSRRQLLNPEVLNLNTLISSMEKMVRRLIGEDVEIATILDSKLGYIKADRVQIEQVIMNLAVNARDAMPKGGKLTIETKNATLDDKYVQMHLDTRVNRYIMLTISDTGCGMNNEVQSHIFEPFFTTKEADKGTGLGLSTVYGIIKQSHGRILVYSEPEKGTTFKIYIPRIEKAVSKESEPSTTAEPLKGTETILAVEDNDIVRDMVDKSLNFYEYTVLTAAYPDEAIKISNEHEGPIHLLLTDVVMPKMSGRELAKHLSPLRPDMKVLYMSGFTDSAIVHHGILDSDVAFLQKPFTPDVLARKVREVIDQPQVDN